MYHCIHYSTSLMLQYNTAYTIAHSLHAVVNHYIYYCTSLHAIVHHSIYYSTSLHAILHQCIYYRTSLHILLDITACNITSMHILSHITAYTIGIHRQGEEQIDRDRNMNRDRWTGTWMRRTGTGKRGKGLLCVNGFQKSQLRLYIQNRVGTIFSLAQHCFHA